MPLTVSTSCGYSPRSTMACFSEWRTPKSPQPGHQSGSAWPLRSLIVSAGLSSICTSMSASSSLHQDLVGRNVLAGGLAQHRLHAIHDVVRHEGLAVVLADVAVG